ncbi:MAG: hypothetical protein ISS31_06590 [Kiritimatiellae bacterium]|nr:hypothetical protein [Kiritimatiellia bacterium]
MTRSTLLVIALILCGPLAARPATADTDDLSRSLVKVSVTAQEFDAYMPWQKRKPHARDGYGIAVGPHRILTSEALVRNGTLIELQRPQSGERLAAQVVESDHQIGLALLEVSPDVAPFVAVDVRPDRQFDADTPLQVVQLDNTLALQTGGAQVLSVAMTELPSAPYPVLLYTLLTDIAVNDQCTIVMSRDRLAGIVLQYNGNRRTAEVLPASVLARFLADADAPPYAGFAMAGFQWRPLVDPTRRAYLGATETTDGVLILACMPGTGAAEILKPNDVLLEWDGHRIDNLGYYVDPDLGRISMPHLIKFRRAPGERVPLRVIREGKELELDLLLARHRDTDALVPENTLREQAPYLIEGGLVLLELNGHFLRARGSDWTRSIDPRLAHIYLTRGTSPEKPGDRVVILAGVLPDRINQDYGMFRQEIVTSVNGQPIRNMRDIYRVIGPKGHVERVGLQGIGIELVLDTAALTEANERISRLYRIPRLKNPPQPLETD